VSEEKRYLLFDIDGTLLLTGGAGYRSLERALRRKTGRDGGMNDVLPDGKTDYLIIDEAFRVNFPDLKYENADIEETLEYYLEYLVEEVAQSEKFRLMPGIPHLLDVCAQAGHVLGLATGNLERGSQVKLTRAGLWEFFPFGGFGSDGITRTDMVRAGVRKVREDAGQEDEVPGPQHYQRKGIRDDKAGQK